MRETSRGLPLLFAVALLLLASVTLCFRKGPAPILEHPGDLVLSSPAFGPGEEIPALYTCDGDDASPPLSWENPPDGTVTFALKMTDPDAPIGTFTHWLICEIPASARQLPEGMGRSSGRQAFRAIEGQNDFRRAGYGGPCPPKGKPHRYFFHLYALDEKLDMPANFTKSQLDAAMRGHILADAQLMGTYARK
mgnify:CR=1 FL=1